MATVQVGVFSVHPAAKGAADEAFARLWPEAVLHNVLDDRLFHWIRRSAVVEPGMSDVLLRHARYLADAGADAVLFTCSAFRGCIEQISGELEIPVLGPNRAMIEAGLQAGPRLALLATMPATLPSLADEIRAAVAGAGPQPRLLLQFVPGAFEQLAAGNTAEHDRLVVQAARCIEDADAILLGQFTLARVRAVLQGQVAMPVLSAPDAAVRHLRSLVDP